MDWISNYIDFFGSVKLESSQIAKLFDVTRWGVVKWVQKINDQEVLGLEERRRPGRSWLN